MVGTVLREGQYSVGGFLLIDRVAVLFFSSGGY